MTELLGWLWATKRGLENLLTGSATVQQADFVHHLVAVGSGQVIKVRAASSLDARTMAGQFGQDAIRQLWIMALTDF